MGIPFSQWIMDLAIQRRIDALDLLGITYITAEEVERVEAGLLKQDIM